MDDDRQVYDNQLVQKRKQKELPQVAYMRSQTMINYPVVARIDKIGL